MRAILFACLLVPLAHAEPPLAARYRLTVPSEGLASIDLTPLRGRLPMPLARLRLRRGETALPLWHLGADPATVTSASRLLIAGRAGDALLLDVLGADASSPRFTALQPAAGGVSRLMLRERFAERRWLRTGPALPMPGEPGPRLLVRPLLEPLVAWEWARLAPGKPLELALPLGFAPVAGHGQLALRMRAASAEDRVFVDALIGGKRVGQLTARSDERASGSWVIAGFERLAREPLVLVNRGAGAVMLRDVQVTYEAQLRARQGRMALSLDAPARRALRLSGWPAGAEVLLASADARSSLRARADRRGEVTLPAGAGAGRWLGSAAGALPRLTPTLTPAPSARDADWLAICPAGLRAALAPLVVHRRAEGLRTAVVDPAAIYAYFGDGRPRAEALRAYLAFALRRWERPPRYVLLVGDASADPACGGDAEAAALALPTIAVHTAYSGRTASDLRIADVDGDHQPDVSIGRMPVRSAEQLAAIVRKTIRYETGLAGRGASEGEWRRRISFVTGPGRFGRGADAFLEQLVSRMIAGGLPAWYALDVTYANARSPYCPSPAAFGAVARQRLRDGCLVYCYIGHGHRQGFDRLRVGDKRYPVLSVADLPKLAAPGGRADVSIAVAIACSTAHFDDVGRERRVSICEALVRSAGGPVATVGSTRISHPYANAILGRELIAAISAARAEPADDPAALAPARLGPLLDRARRQLLAPPRDVARLAIEVGARVFIGEGPSLRRLREEQLHLYVLFGDPALRLRVPRAAVTLTAPRRAALGDTIRLDGRTPLTTGQLELTLVIRRDRTLAAMPAADPGDPEAMMARYRAANRKIAARWQLPIRDGAVASELTLPRDIPTGSYHLVAVARDGDELAVGARPITLGPVGRRD